jgi:hypothetical protein
MFLSLLYITLVGLILAELALVGWSVNFLRKYAFRPNPDLSHDDGPRAWSRPSPGLEFAAISTPSRSASTSTRQETATIHDDDLFDGHRDANRRQ